MSLKDKQHQGIAAAKARGVYKGRKRGALNRASRIGNLPQKAIELSATGKTYKEISEMLGVSVNTVSRYVRKKEIEKPSKAMLDDLGIEVESGFITAFNSTHAVRALLSIYRIASSYPEAVKRLLAEIKQEPTQFKAFEQLLGVWLPFPDFELLKAAKKLPPRPTRTLRGISEVEFLGLLSWATENPARTREVIGRTLKSSKKIELLLWCKKGEKSPLTGDLSCSPGFP